MSKNIKNELKVWTVYFITLLLANFFHELGHSIPAWANGYPAIPTPAKQYSLSPIPDNLINDVSLGGIVTSALFSVLGMTFYLKSSFKYNSSVLAGALAMPSIYTLRFFIAGRGHDGTEFQEAQSALEFNYSGHFVDWAFVIILLIGITLWVFKSTLSAKIFIRLLIGGFVSVLFIVALQTVNNLIFDPIFSR